MRVTGLNPNQLTGIALDLGLRVEWLGGQPPRAQHFRLLPTGERWRMDEKPFACAHGCRAFIARAFERGATLVETPIREYESAEELEGEDVDEVVADVEERYGPQHCSCPPRGLLLGETGRR